MGIFTTVSRKHFIFFSTLFLILVSFPITIIFLHKKQLYFVTAEALEAKPTNRGVTNVADKTAAISWKSEEITEDQRTEEFLRDEPAFVEDELLVKFEEVSERERETLKSLSDSVKNIEPLSADLTLQETVLKNVYKVKLQKGTDIKALIEKLEKEAKIEYAEPNYIYSALNTPNDPSFPELWGLKKIEAEEAWKTTTGSRSLVVAVADTGVDYNHPDLKDNLWENPNEIPNNGLDDDENGFKDDLRGWNFIHSNNDPMDDDRVYGHGTHVAGTIGAVGNNGLGVTGVNWKVQILPVKVMGGDGRGSTDVVTLGIEYAANLGAKVINLSLGGPQYSRTLEEAVNYAHNKGSLVVAAAGNCSLYGCNEYYCSQKQYPAAHENALAVANTTSSDERNSCSSYYPEVDLAAPGTSIYSTNPGNNYRTLTGTSMASPHVAGLAALILSQNPALSSTQLKDRLTSTVDDLGETGRDRYYGYGRINARKALGGEEPPPEPKNPVCLFRANPLQGEVPLRVNFNASQSLDPDGGSITAYEWNFGDQTTGRGVETSHTYTTVGDFTTTLKVTDDEGTTSSCSQDIKVLEKTIKYIETTGSIVFGTDPNNLDQEAFDDRGKNIQSTTHHLTLSALSPSTTYYYKIKSGPSLWGLAPGLEQIVKNGAPFTFTTGPTLTEKENPDLVFGYVRDLNGRRVSGALVSLKIKQEGEIFSAPLSYVTRENEGWVIDLAKARVPENREYFPYKRNVDHLAITVNAGAKGRGEKQVKIPPVETPIEDIILEPIQPPPPETHKICQALACVEVDGPGANQCEEDSDCTQETHFVCQGSSCVEANGPGSNQCTSDPECQNLSPVIEELNPSEGKVNETVTIVGRNFGSTGIVKFNTQPALINIYHNDVIITKVPEGLPPGEAIVTVKVGEKVSNRVPFTVLPPEIQITDVKPPSGKNNESVNLTISGLGFKTGATVILRSPAGDTTVEGTNTTVADSTTITTSFNLNGRNAGNWHLRVTNPDGKFDEVPFVIVSPGTTLSFKIKFQGIRRDDGFNKTVKLSFLGTNFIDKEAETYAAGGSLYQGIIDLGSLASSTYEVKIKGPAHLSETFQATILAGEINYANWTDKELKAGDINGDEIIESLDLAAVIRDFDLGKKVKDGTNTDLNDDLMVEALDLALVIANFNPRRNTP